jgi:hypothetical protein
MRADEVTIKTAKTSKVTAVVAVMSIFSKKRCKLRSANHGNEKPSCQKAKRAHFSREKFLRTKKPYSEIKKALRFGICHSLPSRKGQIPKKLASKSKKLVLICTNLELNSK